MFKIEVVKFEADVIVTSGGGAPITPCTVD